jgi:multidrug resistance efflux pump
MQLPNDKRSEPQRGRDPKPYLLRLPDISEATVPGARILHRSVRTALLIALVVAAGAAVVAFTLSVRITVDIAGALEPITVWDVQSDESGRIVGVFARAGANVLRNEPLVQLDDTDANAEIRTAQQEVAAQRLSYDHAVATIPVTRRDHDDQVQVAENHVLSARASLRGRLVEYSLSSNVDSVLRAYSPGRSVNVDLALSDVRTAESALASLNDNSDRERVQSLDLETQHAQGSLAIQRLNDALRRRDRLTIRAPGSGVILTDDPSQLIGTMAQAGQPILAVADLRVWRAVAYVPEADASRLEPGQKVIIHVPALPDFERKQLFGTVQSIALQPASSNSTPKAAQSADVSKQFRVVISLDRKQLLPNEIVRFRRGYMVQLQIITQHAKLVSVILEQLRGRQAHS